MPDYGDITPDGQTNARTDFQGTYDPLAPSVANGQITPAQWAEYQAKRRKDAILGVLGVLGGTTAMGALGGAMGGGAAAGSAAPEFGIGAANTGSWTTTLPGLSGGAAGAGAAGAAGAGIGNQVVDQVKDQVVKKSGGIFGGMDSKDIMGLLAALTGTVGAIKSNAPPTDPSSATSDPQMQEVIAMMMNRMKKAEPLQDSVLSMANGLLPTQYQNRGGG